MIHRCFKIHPKSIRTSDLLRNVRYEFCLGKKKRSPGPLHGAHGFNQLSLFQKCLPRYHHVASYPIESTSLSQENSCFLRGRVEYRSNKPVNQRVSTVSGKPWHSSHTHTYTYTRKHIHVYEASKHRRLNLANRFRLDRALFFRRELHWLRRTLITIREDCSNSTSLVPTLGLPSLTPLACCAPWERVAGRGACSFLLLPPSRPSHSPQVEKRTAENCATRKLELVEEIYYGQPSTLTIPFSFLSSCLSAPIHGMTRFYIDGDIITIWMLAGHLYRFVYLLSRFEKYRRDMHWGNKIKKQSVLRSNWQ